MVNIVNISNFRNNISDYINRVLYKNDSFLLKRGKSIVAKVVRYKGKEESINKDKISKYSGIWNDHDASIIKKYAKKLRKEAIIIPKGL